ncbi:uncharacterized protein LOC134180265 [Corticium candelabrum]|uniref:uncharacterized protein LOC134180265 n=1 Tax=Corticium candelabrum TaxID=121492 RepID=UPI002E275CF1|nr:uncharacterized protein LOC134180265 [Corticium candelabrum]
MPCCCAWVLKKVQAVLLSKRSCKKEDFGAKVRRRCWASSLTSLFLYETHLDESQFENCMQRQQEEKAERKYAISTIFPHRKADFRRKVKFIQSLLQLIKTKGRSRIKSSSRLVGSFLPFLMEAGEHK